MRVRPLLIFHGNPSGDSRRRAEEKLYDKRVCVVFNETAWADSTNLKDWVKNQYAGGSAYFTRENEPRLLSLDAFAPQMTKGVMAEFKKLNCTTSYIPGGCTGFVQVLDVSLNKPLKQLVAQSAEDHADKYASWYEEGKFTIGERRVLLTQWVAVAWKRLHEEYKDTIIKTFRSVGLSLNPDGSEDHELKIKGLADIKVGDYTRREPEIEDGLGSLLPVDVEAIAAAKVKLAAQVEARRVKHMEKLAAATAKAKSGRTFLECQREGDNIDNLPTTATGEIDIDSEDEDEHEEVLTLGRMHTRSQAQVNQYYTAAENEEGGTVAEMDVEDNGGNSDIDSDQGFDSDSEGDGDFDETIDGDTDQRDENM
jgi:hypothetical protein